MKTKITLYGRAPLYGRTSKPAEYDPSTGSITTDKAAGEFTRVSPLEIAIYRYISLFAVALILLTLGSGGVVFSASLTVAAVVYILGSAVYRWLGRRWAIAYAVLPLAWYLYLNLKYDSLLIGFGSGAPLLVDFVVTYMVAFWFLELTFWEIISKDYNNWIKSPVYGYIRLRSERKPSKAWHLIFSAGILAVAVLSGGVAAQKQQELAAQEAPRAAARAKYKETKKIIEAGRLASLDARAARAGYPKPYPHRTGIDGVQDYERLDIVTGTEMEVYQDGKFLRRVVYKQKKPTRVKAYIVDNHWFFTVKDQTYKAVTNRAR